MIIDVEQLMSEIVPIAIAYGDGVGPEIMHAVLNILKEAEAKIRLEPIEIGEKLYRKYYTSGIASDTWEIIARTKALLKPPITVPQDEGYKNLKVTFRKALSLYATVQPYISYNPLIKRLNTDLVIISVNDEDSYAKISKFAFEYAIKNNRKKITCFSKNGSIEAFNLVAKDYPKISTEAVILKENTVILNLFQHLQSHPEIVSASHQDQTIILNLAQHLFRLPETLEQVQGDQITSGLDCCADIGEYYGVFEALQTSAPEIADKNIANPSGLLNAAVMMLLHIGHVETAALIRNAWKKTIDDGVHTADIYDEKISSKKVGTKEFTDEVIKRL